MRNGIVNTNSLRRVPLFSVSLVRPFFSFCLSLSCPQFSERNTTKSHASHFEPDRHRCGDLRLNAHNLGRRQARFYPPTLLHGDEQSCYRGHSHLLSLCRKARTPRPVLPNLPRDAHAKVRPNHLNCPNLWRFLCASPAAVWLIGLMDARQFVHPSHRPDRCDCGLYFL